jgi:hypothetical protein
MTGKKFPKQYVALSHGLFDGRSRPIEDQPQLSTKSLSIRELANLVREGTPPRQEGIFNV